MTEMTGKVMSFHSY